METDNPSAHATMNWKVCKSVIVLYCLYLSVITTGCNQGANKSNHPNYSLSYLSHPTHENILELF